MKLDLGREKVFIDFTPRSDHMQEYFAPKYCILIGSFRPISRFYHYIYGRNTHHWIVYHVKCMASLPLYKHCGLLRVRKQHCHARIVQFLAIFYSLVRAVVSVGKSTCIKITRKGLKMNVYFPPGQFFHHSFLNLESSHAQQSESGRRCKDDVDCFSKLGNF